jgi:hypothetical protein
MRSELFEIKPWVNMGHQNRSKVLCGDHVSFQRAKLACSVSLTDRTDGRSPHVQTQLNKHPFKYPVNGP